jgi:hypothetical protein
VHRVWRHVAADHDDGNETYKFHHPVRERGSLLADVLIETNTSFITKALLVAGYRFYLPIPPGMKTKRYIGARTSRWAAPPDDHVTAFIQPLSMIQNDKTYASGFTIDS